MENMQAEIDLLRRKEGAQTGLTDGQTKQVSFALFCLLLCGLGCGELILGHAMGDRLSAMRSACKN
jgi:hypothetical protein